MKHNSNKKERLGHIVLNERLLFKVREVADLFGVHSNTIYNWLNAGEIECLRLPGKKIAFTRDQIDTFVNERKHRTEVNVIVGMAA